MSEDKHEDNRAHESGKAGKASKPASGEKKARSDKSAAGDSPQKHTDTAAADTGGGGTSRLSPEADAAAARAREKSSRSGTRKAAAQSNTPHTSRSAGNNNHSGSAGGTTGAPASKGGGSGGWILGLAALLVAVVSLVVSGWLWYRGEQRLASIDSRLNTVEQGLQSNVQDVVMPRLSRLDERLQSLARTSEQRGQKLDSLRKQLKSTQTRNARLAERLDSSGNRWALRQIESLLQAANQRLQLYNDPENARQALQLASQSISDMGDPRLFDVRKQIINEIAALDALPDPDIEGLSLKLNAMVEQVPQLPLASDVPTRYQPSDQSGTDADAGDDSDSDIGVEFSQGWQHFVDSVGEALSRMVTIRRGDGTQSALMPPEQVFFLSQNLQIQLRSARLSLLEHKTDSYRDSLSAARAYLKQYYDTGDSRVSSLIEQLKQMSNVKLDWQAPDISGSLSTLRDQLAQRSDAGDDNAGETSSDQASAESGERSDSSSQTGDAAGKDGR